MEMKLKKRYYRKDINILEAYYYKPPRFEKYRPHMMYIGPVLLTIIILSFVYLVFFLRPLNLLNEKTEQLSEERTEVEEVLNASIGEKDYQEYQSAKQVVSKYETLLEIIETYPGLDLDIVEAIFNTTEGATIIDFGYSTSSHSITVSYESTTQASYPEMLSKLRAANIFQDIKYTGYQGEERKITATRTVTTEESASDDEESEEGEETDSSESTTSTQETTEETVVVGKEMVYSSTITFVLEGGTADAEQTSDDEEG